jgi:hypothetical protein
MKITTKNIKKYIRLIPLPYWMLILIVVFGIVFRNKINSAFFQPKTESQIENQKTEAEVAPVGQNSESLEQTSDVQATPSESPIPNNQPVSVPVTSQPVANNSNLERDKKLYADALKQINDNCDNLIKTLEDNRETALAYNDKKMNETIDSLKKDNDWTGYEDLLQKSINNIKSKSKDIEEQVNSQYDKQIKDQKTDCEKRRDKLKSLVYW